MSFETPWALLLLLILPVIIYRYFTRSALGLRTGKLLFPSARHAAGAGISLRSRLAHLPYVLRIMALILLIIALARPLEQLNRLEVAKRVFLEFVQGSQGDLAGRPNDLIGLITFARYADTACPLTLAHGALASFVEPIELRDQKQNHHPAY
jgi:Ca-activated chloride channel family protein